MPVNYQDFLDSALVLVDLGTEINHRNAASRAYYASFHCCLPIFPWQESRYGGTTHQRLIQDLQDSKNLNNKKKK